MMWNAPELAAGHAPVDGGLDQAPRPYDHLVEVEAAQLREIPQLELHQAADPRHLGAPRGGPHAADDGDEEVARAALEGADERLPLDDAVDDLGAHHLAEERVLRVEVEVERAL